VGDEEDVAGLALDEGADGRVVGRADEEIALPVSGHGPVRRFGRPLADEDHVADRAAQGSAAVGSPPGPPRAQATGQLGPQGTPTLHEERLVDGLVGHPHLRFGGMIVPQPPADLLRRPAHLEECFDGLSQAPVLGQLGDPWSTGSASRGALGPPASPVTSRGRRG